MGTLYSDSIHIPGFNSYFGIFEKRGMKNEAKVTQAGLRWYTGTCTWCVLKSFTELLSGRQTEDRNSRGRTPPPTQTHTHIHRHTPPAPLMREEKSLCRGRTLDVNYWTKSNRIKSRFSLHGETLKKEIQGHSRKQILECLEMRSSFCLTKPYTSLT